MPEIVVNLPFSREEYAQRIAKVRASQLQLSNATYLKLEKPSENVPAMGFASYAPGLYDRILNLCTHPGDTCMAQTMQEDMMKDMAHGHTTHPVNDTAPGNARDAKGAAQKNGDKS